MANFYELLGVPKDADADTIKVAYRQGAKKLHPDRNHDDPEATRKFQDFSTAYEVLSNPLKRREYDRFQPSIDDVVVGNTTWEPKRTTRSAPIRERPPKSAVEAGFRTTFEGMFNLKEKYANIGSFAILGIGALGYVWADSQGLDTVPFKWFMEGDLKSYDDIAGQIGGMAGFTIALGTFGLIQQGKAFFDGVNAFRNYGKNQN